MNLYIHIGRPKTGTTAIQKFLSRHRKELLEQGFLYPESGQYDDAHHGLALALNHSPPDGVKHFPVPDLASYVQALKSEISKLNPESVVLSSEFFSLLTAAAQDEAKKKLLELFDGFNVKIVTYFRNQVNFLESTYSQEIKNAAMTRSLSFDEYEETYLKRKAIDYYWSANQWAKVFGKDAVIVRPFEKSQLTDGDVISDFASVVGISLNGISRQERRPVNVGLTCQRIDVLNRLSLLPLSKSEKHLVFSTIMEMAMLPSEERRYTFLSGEMKRKIARDYADSNKRLAVEFLNRDDGILFLESEEEVAAFDELTGEFIAELAHRIDSMPECREVLIGVRDDDIPDDEVIHQLYHVLRSENARAKKFRKKWFRVRGECSRLYHRLSRHVSK